MHHLAPNVLLSFWLLFTQSSRLWPKKRFTTTETYKNKDRPDPFKGNITEIITGQHYLGVVL